MINLSEIFFFGILFYLAYKLVFGLFLPVFKTTRAFRQQFRNMHDNMQNGGNPFQPTGQAQTAPHNTSQHNAQPKKPEPARSPNNTMGEYIDFEEIK